MLIYRFTLKSTPRFCCFFAEALEERPILTREEEKEIRTRIGLIYETEPLFQCVIE
jgi:hypothetical protein